MQTVKNHEVILDRKAVHGCKTVATTAAELFAGSAAKAGRRRMRVTNEGSVAIYYGIGDNTITAGTTGTGQPILAGDYEIFYFDPNIAMPIYAIVATGTNANVKVSEI